MSQFNFIFEGTTFNADTAAGLVELYRALRSEKPVTRAKESFATKVAAQKVFDHAQSKKFPEWVPEAALKFLTVINNAGPEGADSATMMKALGISEPKAFGGRSAMINRLIEDTGYAQAQVYDNTRTSAGRIWKARKHLPDAIAAIQDGLAALRE
jgi:hypothetical protein